MGCDAVCVVRVGENFLRTPVVCIFFNLRHQKAEGHNLHSGQYVNQSLLSYCTSFLSSESLLLSCLTSNLGNKELDQVYFLVRSEQGVGSLWCMKLGITFYVI
jgi:hypothetical protein